MFNLKMAQQLTEQDVINIINKQKMTSLSTGVPSVEPHTHDRVNNIQIQEKDLLLSPGTGGTVLFKRSIIYTFYLLNQPRVIIFNGKAQNSVGSSTYTTTSGFSAGDTYGTLTSIFGGSTGYIDILFSNGDNKSVLFTNGSLSIAWVGDGGLTSSATNQLQTNASSVTAIVNGTAYIKNAWSLQPNTTSSVVEKTQFPAKRYPLKGTPYYLQGCSWMTIDKTNLANTVTGSSGQYLVYVTSSSGVEASMQVQPASNNLNEVQFNVTVASGWFIYGEFIIY